MINPNLLLPWLLARSVYRKIYIFSVKWLTQWRISHHSKQLKYDKSSTFCKFTSWNCSNESQNPIVSSCTWIQSNIFREIATGSYGPFCISFFWYNVVTKNAEDCRNTSFYISLRELGTIMNQHLNRNQHRTRMCWTTLKNEPIAMNRNHTYVYRNTCRNTHFG